MKSVRISGLAMLLALSIGAQDESPAETECASAPGRENAVQGVDVAFTKYRLEDLPAAVQKTVSEHSDGQPIADIARQERHGQTVWEVEFDREGRNSRIQVANDGTLLAEKEPGPADC